MLQGTRCTRIGYAADLVRDVAAIKQVVHSLVHAHSGLRDICKDVMAMWFGEIPAECPCCDKGVIIEQRLIVHYVAQRVKMAIASLVEAEFRTRRMVCVC